MLKLKRPKMLYWNENIVQEEQSAHHCRSIYALDGNREALHEKLQGVRIASLFPDLAPQHRDEGNGLRPKYSCEFDGHRDEVVSGAEKGVILILAFSASLATKPASLAARAMWDEAKVSGRFPSQCAMPVGSRKEGILAEASDRLRRMLTAACLGWLPWLFLQLRPYNAKWSTSTLHWWHWCGLHKEIPRWNPTATWSPLQWTRTSPIVCTHSSGRPSQRKLVGDRSCMVIGILGGI